MAAPSHTIVTTSKAPGPYPALSQATVWNGMVFCSGSLGIDPETKALVEGTIADRTVRVAYSHLGTLRTPTIPNLQSQTQALTNLATILKEAGSGPEKVLKVMIYVTSISDVPLLNEAYVAFFPEPRPARACVAVKELARGTDVEIECVGYI
ncbi:L-psp endoribonuclease family protein [Hypoxylon crocopeplum]|nr:L-psp endoribonuclease family protein [Hypoxylon crocopeplum]